MKEWIPNAIGRLGGRKFLIALAGAIAIGLQNWLGLDQQTVLAIAGIVIAYITGQSVADGWSGGATSTVARVNSADGKLPLLLPLLLLPLLFTGCATEQAQRTTQSMEDSAIAYDQKRDTIDEAFMAGYRNAAQAKADELASAAIAAETDATGKASAKNIQLIVAKKGEYYQMIEAQCMAMRAKIAAAKLDLVNLLAYNAALKSYFQQQVDFQKSLQDASALAIQLIEQITKGKRAAAGEIVPLP